MKERRKRMKKSSNWRKRMKKKGNMKKRDKIRQPKNKYTLNEKKRNGFKKKIIEKSTKLKLTEKK